MKIEIRWPFSFSFAEPKGGQTASRKREDGVSVPPDAVQEGELGAVGESFYSRATEIWNEDEVYRTKGATYIRNMERKNGFLRGLLRTRRQAVIGRGWDVIPADETPEAKNISDFVKATLDRMDGEFSEVLSAIYAAEKWGYSINEKIWGPSTAPESPEKWAIRAIHEKEWERFRFKVDTFGNRVGLIQDTPIRNDKLPLDKFIVAIYGADANRPYGQGDLPGCYWHDWLMREGWNFWAIYLERFGSPLVRATVPPGTSEAVKTELQTIIDSIQARTGIVIPERFALDYVEATRSGQAEYAGFVDEQKENLQIAILGETLTSTQGDRGSQALGEVHMEVKDELADEDAIWLYRIVNEQIVKPLVDVNFAGAAYPVVAARVQDETDLEQLSRICTALSGIGFRFPAAWAYETFGIPVPVEGEELIERPAPAVNPFGLPPGDGDGQFADPADRFGDKGRPTRMSSPRVHGVGARFAEGDNGPFWRAFTEYEDETSLRGMHAAQDSLVEAARVEGHGIWQAIRDGLIGQAEEALAAGTHDVELIPAMDAWRDLVRRTTLSAHLDGQAAAMDEIERMTGKSAGSTSFAEGDSAGEGGGEGGPAGGPGLQQPAWITEPLPPERAIEWFRRKRPDFDMTVAESVATDEAAWITRIEADKARAMVYERLAEALRSGWGIREFRSAVASDFAVWTGDVTGAAGSLAQADARLATIFRTNIASALNAGRTEIFRAAEDPSLPDPIVAYQYSAVMDDRTRPEHAAMDGRVYGAKDAIWAIWTPPNGYNCRCVLIPIMRSRAALMPEGVLQFEAPTIGGQAVTPDKGFGRIAA